MIENVKFESSDSYVSIDGIVYSKDSTTLVCYPPGRKCSVFQVPSFVKKIGHNVFRDNNFIKEVRLPEGVVSIGVNAFFSCENLEKIEFPSSLKYVGNHSFENCNSLSSVIFKDTVSIYEDAFKGCSSLSYVEIPNCGSCGEESFKKEMYDNLSFKHYSKEEMEIAMENTSYIFFKDICKRRFFDGCTKLDNVKFRPMGQFAWCNML